MKKAVLATAAAVGISLMSASGALAAPVDASVVGASANYSSPIVKAGLFCKVHKWCENGRCWVHRHCW